MKLGYNNFKHLFNQVSFKWNITVFFGGPPALAIDGEHALVFSNNVLVHGLSWSFDEFLKWNDANAGCFIAVLNSLSAYAYFRGEKATIRNKNVGGKRRNKAGKKKKLFSETWKSAVECWVDIVWHKFSRVSTLNTVNMLVEIAVMDDSNTFNRWFSYILGAF